MKKDLFLVLAVLLICLPTFGASTNLEIKLGSNVLNKNGKQYTLPQPVIQNNAGIMVPLELLTEGLGLGYCKKDNILTIIPAEQPEVTFITDSDKGLSKLLALFDQAKSYVYIQMFEINNKTIIDRIIKARNRKVKVMVILDNNDENKKSNVVKQISDNKNCYVHSISKKGWLVYHKKVAIFDDHTVFTGSSNWTNAGFGGNDEQNFIIKSGITVHEMKEKFLDEWDPKRKKEQPKKTVPCGE